MKKSLTLKMFATTFVVISATLLLVFISQYIYFNNFYETHKINTLVDEFNELVIELDDEDSNYVKLINDFNNNNNAYLTITNEENYMPVVFSEGSVLITTLDDNLEYVDMIVTSDQFDTIFSDQLIAKGTTINATGYYSAEDLIMPTAINGMVISADNNGSNNVFTGELKVLDISELNEHLDSTFSTTIAGSEFEVTTGSRNGTDYSVSTIPFTSYKQVDFSKSITLNDRKVNLWVNASLHSVAESTEVLKNFYPYFLLFALLITLIVSYLYSKTVSKPIAKITEQTNLMSNLEFGQLLVVKREDELGVLSHSINKLSSNLENSLMSLSKANGQLKIEYEKEIKQEKARKAFVANVSHEIKTPLGVIKSYSEGIRDAVKKEKINYYIDVILDEVSNMDNLVIELLELAKFDAGKVIYNKTTVDVKSSLEKCLSHFSTAIVDRNLKFSLTGHFGTIYGDEQQLFRVFSNLISNAIKYALENSTITIEGQYDHSQQLSFKNEYEPFSDDLSKLWQRFYKADTSHNREQSGTGLGLSIVKSILDDHDAEYHIESTDNIISFNLIFKK